MDSRNLLSQCCLELCAFSKNYIASFRAPETFYLQHQDFSHVRTYEITHMVRHKCVKIGPSNDLTSFLLYVSYQCLVGNIKGNLKKKTVWQLLILRNHLKYCQHKVEN